MITIHSHGKLIVSGEHAVVHGCPALAIPVTQISSATLEQNAQHIDITLNELNYHHCFSQEALSALEFNSQRHGEHLVLYTIAEFIRQYELKNVSFTLSVTANIPIGRGMGSSAATIVSTLKALDQHFATHMTNSELFQLALRCESLQHDQSSGIDLAVALYNQAILYQRNTIEPRYLRWLPFRLIDTGEPVCSTGECVTHAAKHFNHSLKKAFSDVCHQIDQALSKHDKTKLIDGIRMNHQLLVDLGVVPTAVAKQVADIEATGGAAKISGAGAVRGDKAGFLLVVK